MLAKGVEAEGTAGKGEAETLGVDVVIGVGAGGTEAAVGADRIAGVVGAGVVGAGAGAGAGAMAGLLTTGVEGKEEGGLGDVAEGAACVGALASVSLSGLMKRPWFGATTK